MEDLEIKEYQESVGALSEKIGKLVSKESTNGVIIIDALSNVASAIAMYMIKKCQTREKRSLTRCARASTYQSK